MVYHPHKPGLDIVDNMWYLGYEDINDSKTLRTLSYAFCHLEKADGEGVF